MNLELETFHMSDSLKENLHTKVKASSRIVSLSDDFSYSTLLVSYGILREVGSPNDEIARFLFDSKTNEVVPRESLQGRLIKFKNTYGVEIESTASDSLEIKAYGARELLHPNFSFNPDGTIKSLVIFPEAIFKIAQAKKLTLVIVRDWALNSIFEGFDPQKEYYQTNFWELENNDTLLFSNLLKNKQLAFLGTHDFIAHIANAKEEYWDEISQLAGEIEHKVQNLIQETKVPTLASLILPYTAGVILDDLAQPPSYGSENHKTVLREVLKRIDKKEIPSSYLCTLSKFPKTFEKVIVLSRSKLSKQEAEKEARITIDQMISEIKSSIVFEGMEPSLGEKLFARIKRTTK